MPATKLNVAGAGKAKNPGARNPVYNSVKRFALKGLADLIRVLMENVDNSLLELLDKADNDQKRNMYFEAMREVRLKRESIKRRFNNEMKQTFERVLDGKPATARADDDEELTLIELDDLEDKIAIGNMATRARPQFENDLLAVSERMKLVLKRMDFDENENPLDPRVICECFHNASELLETDIQTKLIFYKLFERYVINNLGHFYQEVNGLFAEKGALPGFKADQKRMKQTTRLMANRIKKSSPKANVEAGLAVSDGNLFATLQQAMVGTAYATAGEPDASGGIPAMAPGSEDQFPADDFLSTLTELQTTSDANQPAGATDPQNLRAATQQQLLSFREQNQAQITSSDSQTIDVVSMLFDFFFDDEALPAPIKVLIGRLQIPILKVAIIDKEFFNQKKHPARKLLDSISRASLEWSDNHDNEQALIDKTEEIVNFLINEFDDDIEVFEKAYVNFEIFVRRESKASEKTIRPLQKQELKKDLQIQAARDAAEGLIAKLTRNRELGFEVIGFLETTWSSVLFNAYLSHGESSNYSRKLKRISSIFVWTLVPKHSEEDRLRIIKTIPPLLRALSKGMKLANIKIEVQNQIFKVLAGEHAKIVKLTSKNIVTRVDDQTVWPEDGGAAAFANAQGIDPGESPDIEFTTNQRGEVEIIENAEDDDSITVIDLTSTTKVIDELNLFTANVKRGQVSIEEEIVMESADGDHFDLIDVGKDHLAQAQALEVGDWIEFADSNSKMVAVRLSGKSNVTNKLVFVNRQGHRVRNLTINGLAMELRSGRAKGIGSSSVFDRAIHAIMTKM